MRLKTRTVPTGGGARLASPLDTRQKASTFLLPEHLIIQFSGRLTAEKVRILESRGARVLQYVPDDAVLVHTPLELRLEDLDVNWAGPLNPADKISPALSSSVNSADVVVEFHPDVHPSQAEAVVKRAGGALIAHPDVRAGQLVARMSPAGQMRAAEDDSVAYIFPASPELRGGTPTFACLGASTEFGLAGQYAAAMGDGWDGPGNGAATIDYVLPETVPTFLAPDTARAELLRALSEWAKYAQLTFRRSSDPAAANTLRMLFATRDHADGYPFDGPRGTLAHTFYPAPPNPEPLAGDMHLDADESWAFGWDIDLFSVALHELGHALGLTHSDNPRSVMYPYYKRVEGLDLDDIAGLQQIYAPAWNHTPAEPDVPPVNPTTPTEPAEPEPPETPTVPATPPVQPVVLAVSATPSNVESASWVFSGTAAGGTGDFTIRWSSASASGVAAGSAVWSATVPLAVGRNEVVFTATDESGATASRSVTITRTVAEEPPATPATPPGEDKTPPSLTVRSPSTTVYSTVASSISVSGVASDNAGIRVVTWMTTAGKAGNASGTTQWETGAIPLLQGMNTIVIRAFDTSGNMSWRTLTVSRR